MKFTYLEKITFTKAEVEILDKARVLLDNIFTDSKQGGEVEALAREALDNISDLLSEEFSEME